MSKSLLSQEYKKEKLPKYFFSIPLQELPRFPQTACLDAALVPTMISLDLAKLRITRRYEGTRLHNLVTNSLPGRCSEWARTLQLERSYSRALAIASTVAPHFGAQKRMPGGDVPPGIPIGGQKAQWSETLPPSAFA